MTQGAYVLIAAQDDNSSDDESDLWDKDIVTFESLDGC